MPGRATIHEVARKAGVAASTVSRAFNAPHLLRPATVDSVKKVSEQLGYVPNMAARALNTGRSGLLGLVLPDLTDASAGAMVHRLQQCADQAEWTVVALDTQGEAERERSQISALVAHCEALVLVGSSLSAPELQLVADESRLVLVDSDQPGTARVLVSCEQALRRAIQALVADGRTHLTWVAPDSPTSWVDQEQHRVLQQLADEGTITLGIRPSDAEVLPEAGSNVVTLTQDTRCCLRFSTGQTELGTVCLPLDEAMDQALGLLRPAAESGTIGLPETRIVLEALWRPVGS